MFSRALRSLDALAARLPFHVDDTERAGAYFDRWRRTADPADLRIVDLWTYCYVRRYFLVKFMQEDSYVASDLDVLIDRVFRNVERGRSQVCDPLRYAPWVSVICRNTFYNYLRVRRHALPLPTDDGPVTLAVPPAAPGRMDAALLLQALLQAIAALPPYLAEVAHLRFVEDLSYEEISARLQKPPPIIRAYANKICKRFRADARLRALHASLGPDSPGRNGSL